jgi:hypothetical protein
VNKQIKKHLLLLLNKDKETREGLAANGELFDGYHPEMEKVHKENGKQLKEIVDTYGWPGKSMVGEEGAEAAWIVFQHNISEPNFFKELLPILQSEADKGEVEWSWVAKTIDRIRMYEGKPQVYGTNYDWDEKGELSPWPIENPEEVDKRRKEMGLPPLDKATAEMRKRALETNEKPPQDFIEQRKKMEAWCHKVGWR